MSKKTFKSEGEDILWLARKENDISKSSYEDEDSSIYATRKSSQKGLQKGWSRATFILKKEYIDKLKALSYWERTTIKEIIDDALSSYLRNKEEEI